MSSSNLTSYLLQQADSTLILAQKNAEWCGHGPVLEQDIAITNISLDLLGQSRNFYQYAAQIIGDGATEDSLAYLRSEREFKNLLITELPNGDWAQSILRQFFFSVYQQLLFAELKNNKDEQLAAIASKSLKEVTYHVRWSGEWVIRLGDGTDESRQRLFNAISELWPYTGELFLPADYEEDIAPSASIMETEWMKKAAAVFAEATMTVPEKKFMHSGGKQGKHTEHMGFILAELQFMQRAFPGAEW